MNSKLVACLVASMVVGAFGAGWALWSGWGFLAAFGIYSLAGSVALVLIAALVFWETAPKPEKASRSGKCAKTVTAYS